MMKVLKIQELVLVALMTAVLAILSPVAIPIGPVPISLGTFAVCLAVTILGKNLGTVSYLSYLLLGLAGLPIFSNYEGGPAKLLGPTGGYLMGMLFLSLLGGFGVERFAKKAVLQYLFFLLGIALCYTVGTVWLSKVLHLGLMKALSIGVLPFIVPDCIKVFLALVLGQKVKVIVMKRRNEW